MGEPPSKRAAQSRSSILQQRQPPLEGRASTCDMLIGSRMRSGRGIGTKALGFSIKRTSTGWEVGKGGRWTTRRSPAQFMSCPSDLRYRFKSAEFRWMHAMVGVWRCSHSCCSWPSRSSCTAAAGPRAAEPQRDDEICRAWSKGVERQETVDNEAIETSYITETRL